VYLSEVNFKMRNRLLYLKYTVNSDCYHLVDANIWKEIADRKIQPNVHAHSGRKIVDKYKVKLFIKKIELYRNLRLYSTMK